MVIENKNRPETLNIISDITVLGEKVNSSEKFPENQILLDETGIDGEVNQKINENIKENVEKTVNETNTENIESISEILNSSMVVNNADENDDFLLNNELLRKKELNKTVKEFDY